MATRRLGTFSEAEASMTPFVTAELCVASPVTQAGHSLKALQDP